MKDKWTVFVYICIEREGGKREVSGLVGRGGRQGVQRKRRLRRVESEKHLASTCCGGERMRDSGVSCITCGEERVRGTGLPSTRCGGERVVRTGTYS